ncbi:MAG: hypothetical protein KBF17_13895, partial [Candidatus Promineofilum sp.]|nr:hypothetical protein [Promineifilum sp.]
QLPNEYTGPHAVLPRGRMKRLNRALADLFHNGMTGNGEPPAAAPPAAAQPFVAQPFQVAGAGHPTKPQPAQPVAQPFQVAAAGHPTKPQPAQPVAQPFQVAAAGHPTKPQPFQPVAQPFQVARSGEQRSRGAQASAVAAPNPQRHYYNTAKAAHHARHGRERYWRYKGAWLHRDE